MAFCALLAARACSARGHGFALVAVSPPDRAVTRDLAQRVALVISFRMRYAYGSGSEGTDCQSEPFVSIALLDSKQFPLGVFIAKSLFSTFVVCIISKISIFK